MTRKTPATVSEVHDNKLYQVLRQFDAGQQKRLLRYLHSPYFVQGKILPRLYELLVAALERNPAGFDRQAVWRELCPGAPYDDVIFRKYCSDLVGHIEEFMAVELYREDPVRRAVATLEFVVNYKVTPLYSSALRQARFQLDKNPHRSLDYFRHQYRIERLYHSMEDFDVKINQRSNIEAISSNLDTFYWVEKLRMHSTALSERKTSTHQYEIRFVREVIEYLQQYPIEETPAIALYYYAYLTISDEENTEHYHRLRALLDEISSTLPPKEALELYDLALHYCTGRLNKGNRIFLDEYFDLFQKGMEKGLFLIRGEFAAWRLNNTIGVALQLGKLDWAESFVEQVRPLLPTENRQNTYTFNLARVYRYQGKFDEVLKLLRNVEYEDPGYNRISKTMLVITYYELQEFDALESFVESFRAYLFRNKAIPQSTRNSYLNLLKFVRRLMRLPAGDKKAIAKLRAEIEAAKSTTVNYDWLLEKVAEL